MMMTQDTAADSIIPVSMKEVLSSQISNHLFMNKELDFPSSLTRLQLCRKEVEYRDDFCIVS